MSTKGTPLSSQLMAETDARMRAEDLADKLSDQLHKMQVRAEVAQQDLERRDQAYFEHIGKVRELLGNVSSEDDLYEHLRRASMVRAMTALALRQLVKGSVLARVLDSIFDYADQGASMHTANAKLFRENVELRQELEALKNPEPEE